MSYHALKLPARAFTKDMERSNYALISHLHLGWCWASAKLHVRYTRHCRLTILSLLPFIYGIATVSVMVHFWKELDEGKAGVFPRHSSPHGGHLPYNGIDFPT